MKRALLLIIALALVPLGLSATGQPEQAKKVVLYTAHEQDIVDGMVPLFEADTGIKVEYVKMGSGEIIQRARAEQANPQGDVIWSIGGEQLEANPDLLEKYVPKEADMIEPVFMVGNNWLPYTGIVMVFVVNTKLVTCVSRRRSPWAGGRSSSARESTTRCRK